MAWESGGSAVSEANQASSIDGGGASPSQQGRGNFVSLGVDQLILDILPKLAEPMLAKANPTGTTIYEAINYITSMLSHRLLNRRSDLLKTSEMTITVNENSQIYDLSPDFLALAEDPWVVGQRPMQQLSGHRSKYDSETAMYPREYELIGSQVFVYPAMSLGCTADIKARYYPFPAWIDSPADVIPFNGMFDGIYRHGVPRVVIKGLNVIQGDQDFELFLQGEFETVLNSRVQPVTQKRIRRSHFI